MPFVLYEHSTSVCAIKVRLTMLEKGLDYEGRFVDLRRGAQFDPAYLRLNPGAVVPTLVHDGDVLTESSVIQYYLEDVSPSPPLMPSEPLARYRVRRFMKIIDDPIHPACGVLTQAISFRKDFRDPEKIEARMARIPDPRRRERQRSVFAKGISSPFVADAVRDFDRFLREMEKTLADWPYLGGNAYSLADAAATPYVNRLEMIGVRGVWSTSCPRVMDWYGRVRARPSFEAGVTRHFTEDDADRMRPVDAADRFAEILER